MVVLGGRRFLMSEVPLYPRKLLDPVSRVGGSFFFFFVFIALKPRVE